MIRSAHRMTALTGRLRHGTLLDGARQAPALAPVA
jgi:hypothetical protein